MSPRFAVSAALAGLLPTCLLLPAMAQTKPKTQVPATERREAHGIVQRLLKQGRIIRSSDVKRGMRGVARSVFQGTTIEEFPIEVLGVLSRVQGGGDIVLIKVLGGTVTKRQSGIIAGMSGSPVYINGKMLGAIALGWGFPKEPIGGVTPITQMIETSLPDPSKRKNVSPSGKTSPAPANTKKTDPVVAEYQPQTPLRVAGHDIAKVVVSRDRTRLALAGDAHAATMTMRPASTLLQVSGYSQDDLPRLRKIYEPYGIEPIIGPASKKPGVKASFKPGSAIGVQLVSGDMDQTAVGTITFRWNNRILAFGHPMFGQGAASLPMATAYVHEIFPSYQRSFKLASPIKEVGALQQDTQFAIGGTVGMKADTIPMSVALHDRERRINRTYHVRVMKDPVLTPQLIGDVAAEAIETTLGLTSDKMVRVGLRMQVDNAAPIVRHNYLYSNGVVTEAALADLGQSLSITQMNEFAKGSIRRVDLDVAVEPVRHTARIKQIFANRNKIKAGESVQINVLLEPTDTPDKLITHTFEFTVPEDAPSGVLRVAAGASIDYWPLQVRVGGAPPQVTNLQELVSAWGKVGAFNELLVQASTDKSFIKIDRQKISDPPPAWSRLMLGARSTSIGTYNEVDMRRATTDFALSGAQFLTVPIEGIKHRESAPAVAGATEKVPAEAAITPEKPESATADNGADTGDSSTEGATGDAFSSLAQRSNFSSAQAFTHAPFLDQVRQWRRRSDLAMQGGSPLPGRNQPDRPITPSVTSPTPTPTPVPNPANPAPAPTPVPAPIVDAKTLTRPALSWTQSGAADFLGGDFEQTYVTNEGQIRLAPPTKLLATTAEPFGWSIAADTQGNTYMGTGNNARIVRISADGKQSLFYDGSEVAVSALTTDHAGNVYAGVTPGGRVYRFSPGGEKTTILNTGQTFVWALQWDESNRLLVGTGGEHGALYRLSNPATLGAMEKSTSAGALELARVKQNHIRALAVRGNEIFAGTGEEGLLVRIDAGSGAATTLFQAAEEGGRDAAETEVLAVAAAPEGVYFGASNSGTVYRWSAGEGVTALYASPQQSVFALQRTSDGRVYAATGNKGIVYQVQPGKNANDTHAGRLLEPKQLQALGLALTSAGQLLVSTGNNAAAYRIALRDTTSGSFVSSVFDAKNVVQWGALRMTGQGAAIETRSGNTIDPDASWSDWQVAPVNDLGEMSIASPGARYLQYRVRLSGAADAAASAQPGVARIELVYRSKNSPPAVALAAPRGGEYWKGKQKVTWAGRDLDSDTLRYGLSISSDEGKTWQPLEVKDAESASFDLDTSKWKDGVYRVKVEASDAARNPEDPQRDEAISLPFVIDNTPPRLEGAALNSVSGDSKADAILRLQANASDALSPLAGAEWHYVDTTKAPDKTPAATPATATTTKTPQAPATTPATKTAPAAKAIKSNKSQNKKAVPTAPATGTAGASSTTAAASGASTAKPAAAGAITMIKADDAQAAVAADAKKDAPAADENKDASKDNWQAAAANDGIFDSRREGITALITPAGNTGSVGAAPAPASTPPASAPANRQIELRAHDAAGNTTTITVPVAK